MAKQTAAQLEEKFNAANAKLRSWPDDASQTTVEYVALLECVAKFSAQWIRAERREQRDGELS